MARPEESELDAEVEGTRDRRWFGVLRVGTLALLGCLLLLAIPRSGAAQILTPGPLSRAHAEIDGDDGCAQCHSSGRRVDRNDCLNCHQDLAQQIRARDGLHGRTYRGRDCASCHVEHLGRGARLIRWPGGRRESFDHDDAGWSLSGAHGRVGCDDCHTKRNERGAKTYLGLRTDCASCHEDPHGGRFDQRCTSCHNEASWRSVDFGQRFDHGNTRFPLRGAHDDVDCASCHGEPARYRGIEFSTCNSCHRDPHRGGYGNSCSECHQESTWRDVDRARGRHGEWLSLAGGHSDVECRGCHTTGLGAPPPEGARCVGCHQDPHEANFGRNCASCHGAIRWLGLPDRLGLRVHDRTPFPLRGAHREAECASCHRPELGRNERYRRLAFDDCADCHEDQHDGAFAARDGGECGPCHTERSFATSTFGVELHATATFALEGKHEAVACSGCHDTPRPRLAFAVDDDTCAGCHENPHGDQFAAEMRQDGCATCHAPAGWQRPRVDHSTWPLTGAHEDADCGACHAPTETDRRQGTGASYRGVPRVCAGCHEDEHAGQFQLSTPRVNCNRCHGTDTFSLPTFDHAERANYPLEGKHAEADCASCHPSVTLRDGTETTRWRLGYRACSDCHADPHAPQERR